MRFEVITVRPVSLLKRGVAFIFDKSQIQRQCCGIVKKLELTMVNKTRELIDKFLCKHRLVDILKGHFAFGILRKLIIEAIRRKRGKKPNVEDDAIIQLISM